MTDIAVSKKAKAPMKNLHKGYSLKTYLKRYWTLYLLLILPVAFFILFRYTPMAYILQAFKKNNILIPPWKVEWAKDNGMQWFLRAFKDKDFLNALKNTIFLNLLDLVIGMPMPIIMALLLNELAFPKYKRITQTVLYLPHFLSWVIISSITLRMFATNDGIVNKLLGTSIPFFGDANHWRASYIVLGIWKECGWNTIIYLAALTGINPELYEAAEVDGATRLKKIWHVTLPGIRSTIVVLLILSVGQMMNISFDRPQILGNAQVRKYCDVLSTFVYRTGIENHKFERATAVGLFQSLVGLVLISGANFVSKKLGEDGIW